MLSAPCRCPRAQPLARLLAVAFLVAAVSGCGGDPEDSAAPVADRASAPSESETSSPGPSSPGPSSPEPSASAEAFFVEASAELGVDFRHDAGDGGDLLFPEMMGGGVAVFDADGDGDLDLYFISGSGALRRSGAIGSGEGEAVNRLYLQGDGGRFVDATADSGLGDPGYGTGVAVGDVDNDGHEDVFVANIGADRLFRGRGDGTFEDVSRRAGFPDSVDPDREWSTSAAFCDVDADGDLDLYVVGYVVFDRTVTCTDKAGRPEYCGPDSFEDRSDTLWINQGDGTFRDRSEAAGLGVVTGAGLGVVCEDVDGDGRVDIYVANDGDPNQLWINQGDGTFVDDALILGTSVNAAGLYEAGMGVVAADFDNDADVDLFLTHLRDETNTFYRNLGPGVGFEDQTARAGLASASTPYTGFGTAAFDIELDGDLDLVIANGRVTRGEPLTDHLAGPWNAYAEPNLVYRNDGGGAFSVWRDGVGALVDGVEVSRGLATGDLDGDGDVDVVLSHIESGADVFLNQTFSNQTASDQAASNQAGEVRAAAAGRWLIVDAYDPRLSRRALGARITVDGAAPQVRTIQGAMSYLSSSDPRAHFGFGSEAAEAVDLAVRWPDGLEERFPGVALDQAVTLRRGEGSR